MEEFLLNSCYHSSSPSSPFFLKENCGGVLHNASIFINKKEQQGVYRDTYKEREREEGVQSGRGDVLYRTSYSREKKSNC